MIDINSIVPLINEAFNDNKSFLMPVYGNSMFPFIHHGNKVELVKVNDLKKNDIVFYKRDDGTYVLHRIYKVEKDSYTLLGDNQVYLEKGIRKDQIFAKVGKVIIGDKVKELKGFKYSLYLFFWNCLLLRRFVFLFKRKQ